MFYRVAMALVRFTISVFMGICAFANPVAADPTQDLAVGYDAYLRGDHDEAAARFLEAAENGNVTAQDSLGVMYANGEGVRRDYALALMWFEIASGNVPEADTLWRARLADFKAGAAIHLTPAQVSEAQKRAREWKPAR